MTTSNRILVYAFGSVVAAMWIFLLGLRFSLVDRVTVEASGKNETETRTLTGFNKIQNRSFFDLEITQGPYRTVVEADKNVLPYIALEQDGQQLTLTRKGAHDFHNIGQVKIKISMPDLVQIDANGSGSITIDSLFNTEDLVINSTGSGRVKAKVATKKLSISSAGSGEVYVSGNTDLAQLSNSGPGYVDAKNLIAHTAVLRAYASGGINIHALDNLDAETNASGSIFYRGQPKLTLRERGSGRVNKME